MFKYIHLLLLFVAFGASADSVNDQLCGYISFPNYKVEFSTEQFPDHLSVRITSLTLLNNAVDADIQSPLMVSGEYGPLVVESIGGSAFSGCGGDLESLALPVSVSNITANAFSPCSALERVKFNGPPPTGIDTCGVNGIAAIYYSKSYTQQWQAAISAYGLVNTHVFDSIGFVIILK